MNKYVLPLFIGFILATLNPGVTGNAIGQEAPSAKTSAVVSSPQAARPRRHHFPFRGKISELDQQAKTFTLQSKTRKRVFHITSLTKMIKNGKPAHLKDAVLGDPVGGVATKTQDGKLQVISVRFGPKLVRATAPAARRASKP